MYPYINTVNTYMHQDIITLQNVSAIYIEEFFADYLLRKMMVEHPQEYTHWAPALKLFYTFLSEKGYLRDAALPIRLLDEFEPHLITILRKRYG